MLRIVCGMSLFVVVMLSVVMINVIKLNVVAPQLTPITNDDQQDALSVVHNLTVVTVYAFGHSFKLLGLAVWISYYFKFGLIIASPFH